MNSIAASARTFMKREGERAILRNTPSGPEPDQHSREKGDRDSKSQRDGINVRFLKTRDFCGTESKDGIETPNGEDDPSERPEEGEDGAFSENLARQSPAAGAQRGADGEFPSASEDPCQLEVCHIRASDEQDADDGPEKQVEALSIIAHG